MILGIDEVGRGPWAGPLVVGAVVLGCEIQGLTDSKKLTKNKRVLLDVEIREKAAGFGLGWVSAEEIDDMGLGPSLVLATKRAVEQVNTPYHEIILDGTINFLKDTSKGRYVTTMKKADLFIPSVSAASIIAKVARDNYMAEHDAIYPGYGFVSNVGYGTAVHRKAIEELGVTPLHRLSFAPLTKYRTEVKPKSVDVVSGGKPTTNDIGNKSEDVAVAELISLGHDIVSRNWKTKYCEIDIISSLGDTIYFTEVKHRKNDTAGDGLTAITAKKLKQMKYAVEFYTHSKKIDKRNLRLKVIATSGEDPEVVSVVEID